MADATSLLPPNATPLERSVELATARAAEIEANLASLWDPALCSTEILPWLAWSLAVDGWDASWTETMKRAAVAQSIELHRRKGTRASLRTVLDRFDRLLELVEWHQAQPRRDPHTFDVILPLDGKGGERSTARFAEAILTEVHRVKPLREHFQMVQQLTVASFIGIAGAARVASFARHEMAFTEDRSQPWAALLTDETGEPLQDDHNSFLDTTP
ncbi:phage tail protein I [Sphingomonas aracearum]|uniref:Phage tail protein I n=1 Tax=Sphingomonas aracearum TaxID=2283317 RepID=A0A369VQL1_9SPHN|nr:phage tail protein I [Sphingomonas aracearum]RDE04686.1 phage tail protein I [Sphingomonas aracearum]